VYPALPLLLLSRHAIDSTGEPVEFAQSWYRGDRYKFITRLRGSRRGDDHPYPSMFAHPGLSSPADGQPPLGHV
jgi:hypothetical protein